MSQELEGLIKALQQFSTIGTWGIVGAILIFIYMMTKVFSRGGQQQIKVMEAFLKDRHAEDSRVEKLEQALGFLRAAVEQSTTASNRQVEAISSYAARQLDINDNVRRTREQESSANRVMFGEIRGAITETNQLLHQHNDHEQRQLTLIENQANRLTEHEKSATERLVKHEQASTARTEQLRADMHVMLAQRDAALATVVKKVDILVETVGRLAEVVDKLADFGLAGDTLRELQKMNTTLERLATQIENGSATT